MAQNPKGLILDLRDNPGGYLQTAVEVVSQFVDHGPVVYEQTSDGKKKEYDAISGGLATKIPMVVLINSNSASASEITAGALQDDGARQTGRRWFHMAKVPCKSAFRSRIMKARWRSPLPIG